MSSDRSYDDALESKRKEIVQLLHENINRLFATLEEHYSESIAQDLHDKIVPLLRASRVSIAADLINKFKENLNLDLTDPYR